MGKAFKLNTQNKKKTKKVAAEFKPLKSPYVKEKSTTKYPIFFDFLNEYEPPKVQFKMEPNIIWE